MLRKLLAVCDTGEASEVREVDLKIFAIRTFLCFENFLPLKNTVSKHNLNYYATPLLVSCNYRELIGFLTQIGGI